MRRLLTLVLAVAFARTAQAAGLPPGNNRAAPETWDLWRCAPFPFPTSFAPLVPEAVADSAIAFGARGKDLVIVTPDTIAGDGDGRALQAMVRMIGEKFSRAVVVAASGITPALKQRDLLLVGTPDTNSLVGQVVGGAAKPLPVLRAGGYRVWSVASPFAPGRHVILALGQDAKGAWPAAALLAYSFHPEGQRLTALHPWPVRLPEGCYWSPFTAECAGGDDTVEVPPTPVVAAPAVPFGVRIWGSPMPTLGSYQRLLRSLRGLGINTVAVQSGGWPDLPDAAERFRTAVRLAAAEGLSTILYVGNDLLAHRPAPLTENHRAVVMATKDLPGLLEFHLYNQLAADLTPAERALVEEQVRWLRSVTHKPIGMEVVWGHDTAVIPAEKVALIRDLKSWGVDVIANDDAPIGGWSHQHRVAIWEPRLRELAKFGLPMEAVIQAHVPFVDPTVPSAAEVRSQFWWALAGGARGFLFEAAYLFTSLTNRGLLSWDLRPLPDGRADEVRRLAGIAPALQPLTSGAVSSTTEDWEIKLGAGSGAVLRGFVTHAGRRFLLVLNASTTEPAHATLAATSDRVRLGLLASNTTLMASAPREWHVDLLPGDAACLEITRAAP